MTIAIICRESMNFVIMGDERDFQKGYRKENVPFIYTSCITKSCSNHHQIL